MKWIKLYTEETVRGTTFSELNVSERGIWFSLLALAGYSPDEGYIYLRQGVGYSNDVLAATLNCEIEILISSLEKLIRVDKIAIDENKVISILNWTKYQDDYTKYYKGKRIYIPKSKHKSKVVSKVLSN